MILLRARTEKKKKLTPASYPQFSISHFSHAPVTSWDNNKCKVNIDQA